MNTLELAENITFFNKQNEDLYIDKTTKLIKKDFMMSYKDTLVKDSVPFSAYLCDIDDFAIIKDFYGVEIAENLLIEVARKLEDIVKDKGLIAKCLNDSFLILFEHVTEYDELWTLGREINIEISKELFKSLGDSFITVTVAGARYPTDAKNLKDFEQCLDKALYRGKIKGKNCFIIYLAEKHQNIVVKERDRLNNFYDVTAKVFDILANADTKVAINDCLHFVLTRLQLDHIGIETKSGIYFSHVNRKVNTDSFKYIDFMKLDKVLTGSGVFKYSDRRELSKSGFDDILSELESQREESMLVVALIYNDNLYGILRVDMLKPRIWQAEEVSLFVTIARTLAMLLYVKHISLNELISM